MQFPREQLRRVPFLARYNGKTLKERRTCVLLLDGNGLSTAPGRIISLAADDLVGADADIVLLVLGQLGQGLGGSLGLHSLSTLEVLLGAILNLITSDGSCLLDGDLCLLALVVLDTVDLRSLDNDLSSGLVLLAQNLAAVSAADDQIIGTALLGGGGDYVFLLGCCCGVVAGLADHQGSACQDFIADGAADDDIIGTVLRAGGFYDVFDLSSTVLVLVIPILVVGICLGFGQGDLLLVSANVLIGSNEGLGAGLAGEFLSDELGGVFLHVLDGAHIAGLITVVALFIDFAFGLFVIDQIGVIIPYQSSDSVLIIVTRGGNDYVLPADFFLTSGAVNNGIKGACLGAGCFNDIFLHGSGRVMCLLCRGNGLAFQFRLADSAVIHFILGTSLLAGSSVVFINGSCRLDVILLCDGLGYAAHFLLADCTVSHFLIGTFFDTGGIDFLFMLDFTLDVLSGNDLVFAADDFTTVFAMSDQIIGTVLGAGGLNFVFRDCCTCNVLVFYGRFGLLIATAGADALLVIIVAESSGILFIAAFYYLLTDAADLVLAIFTAFGTSCRYGNFSDSF